MKDKQAVSQSLYCDVFCTEMDFSIIMIKGKGQFVYIIPTYYSTNLLLFFLFSDLSSFNPFHTGCSEIFAVVVFHLFLLLQTFFFKLLPFQTFFPFFSFSNFFLFPCKHFSLLSFFFFNLIFLSPLFSGQFLFDAKFGQKLNSYFTKF